MTTGHSNPGYENVVSQLTLASANPCARETTLKIDKNELEKIKGQARRAWSVRDQSATTYGFYHTRKQKERTNQVVPNPRSSARPASPDRRNNPHPHLVFLTTRLKKMPGYFDANNPDKNNSSLNNLPDEDRREVEKLVSSTKQAQPQAQAMSAPYSSAKYYLQSLPDSELGEAEQEFKQRGIKTTGSIIDVRELSSQSRIAQAQHLASTFTHHQHQEPRARTSGPANRVNHYERTYDDYGRKPVEPMAPIIGGGHVPKEHRFNPAEDNKFMLNQLNPYIENDYRIYRENYEAKRHGMPHAFAKKPFRGDFSRHYDWHPRLEHHRLPYMY